MTARSLTDIALRRTSAWPERESGDRAGDPEHLVLVADDAVGLLEDRLQVGMQILDRLLAELRPDELRDERHRPGSVERNDSREFTDGVRLQLDDVPAHPGAFELEDAVRVAPAQHLERLLVVERDVQDVDVDALVLLHVLHGVGEDGQVCQAEEVHLERARSWRCPSSPAARRPRPCRPSWHRHVIRQRVVRDQHARRMDADVAVQPFQGPRSVDQGPGIRAAVVCLLQLGVALRSPGRW